MKPVRTAMQIALDQIFDQQHELQEMRNDSWNEARGVQARVEPVYNLFGQLSSAPRPLQGESPQAYRKRALTDLKQFSPTWRDIDLFKLPTEAIDLAEKQIFADAQQEAVKPTALSLPKDGSVVTRVRFDEVGRPHKSYHALDSGVIWNRFKLPTRFVKRWGDEKTGQPCF
jgi:hypothetical protein